MTEMLEMLSRLERQIHCYQRSCHQKAVKALGLHYGQPLMLMILLDKQPLNQKDLAAYMNVTPASVTVSVKRMEKNGWITKTPSKEDLRCTTIRLTEKGERLALRCREEMERIEREKYIGFSLQEQEKLAEFYERMHENLKRLEQKGTAQ